jgi:hypothetical protein
MQSWRLPHLLQDGFEDIELCIKAGAFEKAFPKSGSTTTAPKRLEWNISIARFMSGHAHEGDRSPRFEGHARHVLLF